MPSPDTDSAATTGHVRFQVIFAAETVKRLDHIKDKLEYTSRADVLRAALKVLEVVVDEAGEGKELWIKDKDGTAYRLVLG
jgi:hypothetical protein